LKQVAPFIEVTSGFGLPRESVMSSQSPLHVESKLLIGLRGIPIRWFNEGHRNLRKEKVRTGEKICFDRSFVKSDLNLAHPHPTQHAHFNKNSKWFINVALASSLLQEITLYWYSFKARRALKVKCLEERIPYQDIIPYLVKLTNTNHLPTLNSSNST